MKALKYTLVLFISVTLISCGSVSSKSTFTPGKQTLTSVYNQTTELAEDVLFVYPNMAANIMLDSVEVVQLNTQQTQKAYVTGRDNPISQGQVAQGALLVVSHRKGAVLNTTDWQPLREFNLQGSQPMAISPNAQWLHRAGRIEGVPSGELVYEYQQPIAPGPAVFSPDSRYLVQAGHQTSAVVVDLEQKQQHALTQAGISGSLQLVFADPHTLYIDEGAQLRMSLGGEYVNTLKQVNVATQTALAEFSSKPPISCWAHLPASNRLAVFLVNGDLLVLDSHLQPQTTYDLGQRVEHCVAGSGAELWLATHGKGVLHVDLNQKTLSHVLENTSKVVGLSVAADGKHIGVIERSTQGDVVTIFSVN